MNFICYLWDIFTHILAILVIVIIIAHIAATYFFKKKSLKLDTSSTVVLTGGCMGIGKQMALQIAKLYKSTIIIVDRRQDLYDNLEKQLSELGSTSIFVYADLSNDESVQKMIEQIKKKGQISMLIYNAGIVIPKRSYETSQEQHMMVMKVNYFTPIKMIHKLRKQLQGGHIAVVASMVAIFSGGINYSTYTASKHAIFGYLSSLRQEFVKDKIPLTVSIGCPYAINTTMFNGFKTKLDFVCKILDETYVGKRLVKEFVERKQVCFLYQYESIIFKLAEMMPSQLVDWSQINLDESNFQKISNKHTKQLKQKKNA